MKKIGFKKNKISIKNIGRQRFWFGIISGFFSAISISLIFNRTRELIRLITSLSQDLLIFEKQELVFFNYFFVSLSTVLGFSITIWIWMGNPINEKKKHKLYKQQVRTNTQLFFWLILFLIAQLACLFLYFITAEVNNYDYPVNLYKEYKLLFILTPIVIFLQSWFLVRRIYKTTKWILFSLIITLVTIFILKVTTTIDQNILNEKYLKQYEKSYSYIKNTISESEKKYNIKFNEQAIKTIEQRKSWNSVLQIRELKKSFAKDTKVSIDTIILQKIIIHNTKAERRYRYHGDSITLINWKYPLPKDILKQINNFKSNSNETYELFKTLKEEILLVNKSKIILNDYKSIDEKISKKEKLELKVNIMVVEQLIKVRDSLKNLEEYSELSKTLPVIKNVP
jgi:hypothetical protein